MSTIVLAMRLRIRAMAKRSREARSGGAKKKAGVVPACIPCSSRFANAVPRISTRFIRATKKEFGSETPTDANVIMPCRRARPRPLRGAHDCRRSTAALAKGTFVVFGATSGQASWDVAAFVRRVLPAPADPSPASSSHPGHSAGGLMPKAARERVASPRYMRPARAFSATISAGQVLRRVSPCGWTAFRLK